LGVEAVTRRMNTPWRNVPWDSFLGWMLAAVGALIIVFLLLSLLAVLYIASLFAI
jgi:hypothetical protein